MIYLLMHFALWQFLPRPHYPYATSHQSESR